MIDLEEKYLFYIKKTINDIIPDVEIRAFGSRTEGKSKRFSDFDIALYKNSIIEQSLINNLKEQFAESDLPFIIDIVDWNVVSDSFKKIIQNKYIVI